MKYYPMNDLVKEQSKNHQFSYTVIINLKTSKYDVEEYINKTVRVNSDTKLQEDDLVQKATNVIYGLIETHPDFALCEQTQIIGITFCNAYDRSMS
ncbi:hypothetical protein EC604_01345 [Paenibacillus amylolyticus]|uniref:Uncharacterized protein n=1 Tax=Paenibacillus amylolyticus TaxID=1451 RepID=A0A5M9WLP9_PAEAM|nr:hypothetical protein [Paenibacillus amylolyticus]KAA8782493.1 hypothetical protein EC604_01345 [Paenibacillus amylolyticus]